MFCQNGDYRLVFCAALLDQLDNVTGSINHEGRKVLGIDQQQPPIGLIPKTGASEGDNAGAIVAQFGGMPGVIGAGELQGMSEPVRQILRQQVEKLLNEQKLQLQLQQQKQPQLPPGQQQQGNSAVTTVGGSESVALNEIDVNGRGYQQARVESQTRTKQVESSVATVADATSVTAPMGQKTPQPPAQVQALALAQAMAQTQAQALTNSASGQLQNSSQGHAGQEQVVKGATVLQKGPILDVDQMVWMG